MAGHDDKWGTNPFASPRADWENSFPEPDLYPEGRDGSPPYANFWQRLCAHVIDHVFFNLIGAMFVIIYYWILLVRYNDGLSGHSPYSAEKEGVFIVMGLFLWLSLFAFCYSVFPECSRYQGSPGKILMGLKVTDLAGNRISFVRSAGRFFSKFFSQFLYIGYLIQPFTEHKQTLHDMMAGTLVVKK